MGVQIKRIRPQKDGLRIFVDLKKKDIEAQTDPCQADCGRFCYYGATFHRLMEILQSQGAALTPSSPSLLHLTGVSLIKPCPEATNVPEWEQSGSVVLVCEPRQMQLERAPGLATGAGGSKSAHLSPTQLWLMFRSEELFLQTSWLEVVGFYAHDKPFGEFLQRYTRGDRTSDSHVDSSALEPAYVQPICACPPGHHST